jgi:hypothetical protein
LAFDAGRIGDRSEQVEDRAGAELNPRRRDVLGGRMVRRREHETDTRLVDAAGDFVRTELDLDAECAEHVGST